MHNRWVVLSGCSGGGKSTLLDALAARGYAVCKEPGRDIVREQLAIDGDALPWRNSAAFARQCIDRCIEYLTAAEPQHTTFFDRSLVDAVLGLERVGPGARVTDAERALLHTWRYFPLVFLAPPWPDIYVTDTERTHDLADAEVEYRDLVAGYARYEYEIAYLPKVGVSERVEFVESKLSDFQV